MVKRCLQHTQKHRKKRKQLQLLTCIRKKFNDQVVYVKKLKRILKFVQTKSDFHQLVRMKTQTEQSLKIETNKNNSLKTIIEVNEESFSFFKQECAKNKKEEVEIYSSTHNVKTGRQFFLSMLQVQLLLIYLLQYWVRKS